ncbi:S-layer homology domain-containing protein [Sporosarcina sp. 179-K 8C2 HS]|uniref:S-layer homology domain-containing protein n=1 Tax=Sporosarcina sp. 179-K 8C2 HS TaxID=3142387 RepID=UPI00399EF031
MRTLVENKLTKGKTATTFEPNSNVTRAKLLHSSSALKKLSRKVIFFLSLFIHTVNHPRNRQHFDSKLFSHS